MKSEGPPPSTVQHGSDSLQRHLYLSRVFRSSYRTLEAYMGLHQSCIKHGVMIGLIFLTQGELPTWPACRISHNPCFDSFEKILFNLA
jgi:hypothetical protein